MKILKKLLHLVFGGVFVYAGVLKAWNPQAFLDDVRSFDLLGDPWAAWLAMGLPWLEIFAGLAVITGVLRRGGLLVLNGALVGFLGKAVWEEERDVSDPATLKAIAAEHGRNAGLLWEAAQSPEVAAAHDAYTQEAIDRDVFGAPTYAYRGELFWGQDRLDFLERALAA